MESERSWMPLKPSLAVFRTNRPSASSSFASRDSYLFELNPFRRRQTKTFPILYTEPFPDSAESKFCTRKAH